MRSIPLGTIECRSGYQLYGVLLLYMSVLEGNWDEPVGLFRCVPSNQGMLSLIKRDVSSAHMLLPYKGLRHCVLLARVDNKLFLTCKL